MKINHPIDDRLVDVKIILDDTDLHHQEVSISVDNIVTISELSNFKSY